MTDLAQPAAVARETHRFVFSGTAREYFGVWIVNVLLTIVTLGIYSAWAKVRRNRYFYGNTALAGHAFEYHARGSQLALGRIIVVGTTLAFVLALKLLPLAAFVLAIPVSVATPWLIARSLRFNARMTSYRGVTFDFLGTPREALEVFFVLPSLVPLTFGLMLPYVSRRKLLFAISNLRYGGRPFSVAADARALLRVFRLPAAIFGACLAIGLVGGLSLFAVLLLLGMDDWPQAQQQVAGTSLAFVLLGIPLLGFGLASFLYKAGVRNVGYSATVLDGRHRLASDVPRWRYAEISLTNLAATVITLGLMRPWAEVRMASFLAAHTAMTFDGPFGEFHSVVEGSGGAVAAEFAAMSGYELGV